LNVADTASRFVITPRNTAWATGGNAQPSGTVVTADGSVVVVVDDVVVDEVVVVAPTTVVGGIVVGGTVVADGAP
jgi:hypothetical protein